MITSLSNLPQVIIAIRHRLSASAIFGCSVESSQAFQRLIFRSPEACFMYAAIVFVYDKLWKTHQSIRLRWPARSWRAVRIDFRCTKSIPISHNALQGWTSCQDIEPPVVLRSARDCSFVVHICLSQSLLSLSKAQAMHFVDLKGSVSMLRTRTRQ